MQNPITVEKKGEGGETDFAGSFKEQNYCAAWDAIYVANDDVTETTQTFPQQHQVLNSVSTFTFVGLRETCSSSQRETEESVKQPRREKCAINDKMCCQIAKLP